MNAHECAATKICTKCKAEKPTDQFANNKRKKDGKHYQCKACQKATLDAWRAKNPDKVRAQGRRNYANNSERFKAHTKQYAKENPEKVKAAQQRWQKENQDRVREKRRERYQEDLEWRQRIRSSNLARHKRLRQSIPAWQCISELRNIWSKAQRISQETGVPHDVDHIIPLTSRCGKVSGLTVPWNLQIIPSSENQRKNNFLVEDIVWAQDESLRSAG